MSGSTISRRLSVIVFLSIAITVLGITAASVWREADRYAQFLSSELQATAGVFATAVSGPTAERDRNGILRVLKAIGRVPGLSYARVEDSWGRVLAEIGTGVRLKGATSGTADRLGLLQGQAVEISVPVIRSGTKIGTLSLLTYPVDLWPRIWAGIRDILIWALIAGSLGLLASVRLSRGITKPIRNLTDTMATVRSEQEFSRTVEGGSIRELSVLADSFNDMMDNIRERDDRLAKHRDRLEDDVADRTRDLLVAKDEAEAANAAKSDFLATMSHEIRTPMNGMLVMAELLTKADLSENLRRYAEVISSSGRSLMTIINDILDLSKIEAGKLDLETTDMRISAVIRDVLVLFQERAAEKQLDLAGFIDPAVKDAVLSDPVRLRQIVGNLVSNAIKFTETGHVAVNVTVLGGREHSGHQSLRISIEDTGIGIPQDKVATIFEAFSQADQSTTRKFGGTGLGLAICKKLAESFHGRLYAESTVGKGSKFIIEINVETAAEQPVFTLPDGLAMDRAILVVTGGESARNLEHNLRDLGTDEILDLGDMVETSLPAIAAGLGAGDVLFADLEILSALPKSSFEDRLNGPYFIAISTVGAVGSDDACATGRADAISYRPVLRPDLVEAFAMLTPEYRATMRTGMDTAPAQGGGLAETMLWPSAKVLVADDSPVNQEVAREALSRFGIVPEIVENGAEALRAASERDFDLILMDCSMPVMDGYEATRRIREQENGRVPIVALTAQVMDEARFDWQSAGMDSMLAKPFTLDQLRSCLDDHLDAGEMAALPEPEKLQTPNQATEPVTEASISDDLSSPANHSVQPISRGDSVPESQLSVGTGSRLAILQTDHLDTLAGGAGDGRTALLDRILSLFEKHAPPSLEQIAALIDAGDSKALVEAAHSLKSMSANIGAERLAEFCGDMEKAAKAGAVPEDPRALNIVFGETLDAVRMFKAVLSPDADALSGLGW